MHISNKNSFGFNLKHALLKLIPATLSQYIIQKLQQDETNLNLTTDALNIKTNITAVADSVTILTEATPVGSFNPVSPVIHDTRTNRLDSQMVDPSFRGILISPTVTLKTRTTSRPPQATIDTTPTVVAGVAADTITRTETLTPELIMRRQMVLLSLSIPRNLYCLLLG